MLFKEFSILALISILFGEAETLDNFGKGHW